MYGSIAYFEYFLISREKNEDTGNMGVKRGNWKGRERGKARLDTVTSRRLVYEVVKLKGFDVARLSDVATRCYAFRFDRCVGLTRLLRT